MTSLVGEASLEDHELDAPVARGNFNPQFPNLDGSPFDTDEFRWAHFWGSEPDAWRNVLDEINPDTASDAVRRFLTEGDKVKVTLRFRGREMAHPEIGRRILERLIDDLGELAIAETQPRQEGNQMHTILSQRAGRKSAPKRETTETTTSEREDNA